MRNSIGQQMIFINQSILLPRPPRSQLCINTAIVYMHRFYAFHSFTHFHRNGIAAASLFLAAKVRPPTVIYHIVPGKEVKTKANKVLISFIVMSGRGAAPEAGARDQGGEREFEHEPGGHHQGLVPGTGAGPRLQRERAPADARLRRGHRPSAHARRQDVSPGER